MSPFLLGVSLSSWNRVLGRTLTLAYGEASGFFSFQITGVSSCFKFINEFTHKAKEKPKWRTLSLAASPAMVLS